MIINPTWKTWTGNLITKNKKGNVEDINLVNPAVKTENFDKNKIVKYIPIGIFPTAVANPTKMSILQYATGHLTTAGNSIYTGENQEPAKPKFNMTTIVIIGVLIGLVALYFYMK